MFRKKSNKAPNGLSLPFQKMSPATFYWKLFLRISLPSYHDVSYSKMPLTFVLVCNSVTFSPTQIKNNGTKSLRFTAVLILPVFVSFSSALHSVTLRPLPRLPFIYSPLSELTLSHTTSKTLQGQCLF